MALWNTPKGEQQADKWASSKNPNRAAKGVLAQDVQKAQNNQLGLTQAEQGQLTDATTQQVGAGIEAQNRAIAQQGMASSGGAGPSARYAALQRSMGQNVASGTAQAQTEAARLSQAKSLSQKQDIDARMAQAAAAQTQKNQYWTGILLNTAGSLMDTVKKSGGIAAQTVA